MVYFPQQQGREDTLTKTLARPRKGTGTSVGRGKAQDADVISLTSKADIEARMVQAYENMITALIMQRPKRRRSSVSGRKQRKQAALEEQKLRAMQSFSLSQRQTIRAQLHELTAMDHAGMDLASSTVQYFPDNPPHEGVPLLAVRAKAMEPLNYAAVAHRLGLDIPQEGLDMLTQGRRTLMNPQSRADVGELISYYHTLINFERHFCDRGSLKGLSFVWYDHFCGRQDRTSSLEVERACTMFNMAALLTDLALNEDKTTAKGLANSIRLYEEAAGIYVHMQSVLPDNPVTADTSLEMCEFLRLLTLSQADECNLGFKFRVCGNNTKCSQAFLAIGKRYGRLCRLAEALQDLIPKQWKDLMNAKSYYYMALAEYNWAVDHLEQSAESPSYSLTVTGRIVRSQSILRKALKYCGSFRGLRLEIQRQLAQVQRALLELDITVVEKNHDVFAQMRTLPVETATVPVSQCRPREVGLSDPQDDPFLSSTESIHSSGLSEVDHMLAGVQSRPATVSPFSNLLGNFHAALISQPRESRSSTFSQLRPVLAHPTPMPAVEGDKAEAGSRFRQVDFQPFYSSALPAQELERANPLFQER